MPDQAGRALRYRAPMKHRHAEGYEKLRRAVLETEGDAAPALRARVEQASAGRSGRAESGADPTAPALPEPLAAYVEKVALHAYRVTDEDIETLRAAGHSEDAVFELTLAAALGAAAGRYERALSALEGLA